MTVREDLITAALALASDKGYSIRERTEASRTATFFLAYEESAEAERAAGYVESDREIEEIRDEINTNHQLENWRAESAEGVIRIDRANCERDREIEGGLWVRVDIGGDREALVVDRVDTSGNTFSFCHLPSYYPCAKVRLHPMRYVDATNLVRLLKKSNLGPHTIYALEELHRPGIVQVGAFVVRESEADRQRAEWEAELRQGTIPVGRKDCMSSTNDDTTLAVMVDIEADAEALVMLRFPVGGLVAQTYHSIRGPRVAVNLYPLPIAEAIPLVRSLKRVGGMSIYVLEEGPGKVRIGAFILRSSLNGTLP